MSMLQQHQQALAEIDESFHNFMLKYNVRAKIVYGFVEGKDDTSFYQSAIERFIPDDWGVNLIVAGSKSKVLRTFKSFDWERFDPQRIVFFVDRDVDELLIANLVQADNIYQTDGYSIENSIVNEDTYMRLLGEAYSVIDTSVEERLGLCAEFSLHLDRFKRSLLPIMAQIVLWRMNNIRAYQNEVDIGRLFQFLNGELKLREAFLDSDALVHEYATMIGAEASDHAERRRIEGILCHLGLSDALVRGKYLLWMMAGHLNFRHLNISEKVSAYDRPPKARTPLGAANVMFAASPRTRVPPSLRAFLDRTVINFINSGQISLH